MFEPIEYNSINILFSLIPLFALIGIGLLLIVLYRKNVSRQTSEAQVIEQLQQDQHVTQKRLEEMEATQKQLLDELQQLREEKGRSDE
ncbi:hypothetical protein MM326_03025 [Alkalihalobacillus sp. LMS6]|uniref:hypothetical protein n=1 Tax=Bacillaceae TaxID=186817 RepID=UPI000C0744A3|nr:MULTISPECIES: hypothetical protein [Bacillaceae]UTR07020.1 hypothetical protein MM326_03025 [Alkalihalobacillus sp. LMS6]